MKRPLLLVCSLLILTACASAAPVVEEVPPTKLPPVAAELPTPAVSTAVSPTSTPEIEAGAEAVVTETAVSVTEPPPPTAEPEAVDVGLENGRTAEGAYYLGSPDAPLTLIDYSDFL